MTRIFVTLCVLGQLALLAAFGLGYTIGDASLRDAIVQRNVGYHMLTGLAALVFNVLVHAIVLTYFMGTGRWLEETSQAYRLSPEWQQENRRLKYRTIPLMVVCIGLLVGVGASGGAADPASAVGFREWRGVSAASIHMLAAAATWGVNVIVNLYEYAAIERNGAIVNIVLGEVRRMRRERGMDV